MRFMPLTEYERLMGIQIPDCSIDLESRSACELKKSGVYPYASHATTDLLCFAWAIGDEAPQIWHPGLSFPERVAAHIAAGGLLRAWNAQFERVMWRELGPRYGFPVVALEQWICTAAEAAAMALPRGLDACAAAIGLEETKDVAGYRLMLQMCKPRSMKGDMPVWWDDDARKEKLYAYCQQDVRLEHRIAKAVRRLPARERELYLLDQRINDRGVAVDLSLVDGMQRIARTGMERAGRALSELTGGAVSEATQLGRLKTWLAQEGASVGSLAKKPLKDLLDGELPDLVRDALEARADAAKSSNAKLDAMLNCVSDDGRMRGLLLYHGAATGRWTGRLAQPHNYPRPTLETEPWLDELRRGDYEVLDVVANPLEMVSSALRSCLTAAPAHALYVADYAGIEARIVNWLAGQWDIVDQFARKEDVYWNNALHMAEMQGKPLPATATRKTHPEARQGGKAVELGCGFGMGGVKFRTTAADMFGLEISEEDAKAFVAFYRETHPKVVQLWRDFQDAAIAAVEEPGTVQSTGEGATVRFTKRGGYLWMLLPSGRPLCYARPKVELVEAPWSTEEKPAKVKSLTAWATNSYTRRWEPCSLYGGLLVENAVQAIARDWMAEGMLRVENAGYPVILSCHDEVVSETPTDFGDVTSYEKLLAQAPSWGVGCPITAEGWKGPHYRK